MQYFRNSRRRMLNGITLGLVVSIIVPRIAMAQAPGNTSYGSSALSSNTTGGDNSAFGDSALRSNTDGTFNTASGYRALYSNNDGSFNTAMGQNALYFNTIGSYNIAMGQGALFYNISGDSNTASGTNTLFHNIIGNFNTAVGDQALLVSDGNSNTAIGSSALINSAGNGNIAVGANAGGQITTGSNNIDIGSGGSSSDNGVIRIGSGDQSATMIAAIYGTSIPGGQQVYINKYGHLGTLTSSQRFKEDIKSIDVVSDKLLQLRPVSFHYKQAADDGTKPLQYGLIAEEVAKVYPELVEYDKDGKPFAVHYNLLTPLLLRELQKEHSENVSRQAEIAELKKQLISQRAEMLTALQQHDDALTTLQQKMNQLEVVLHASTDETRDAQVALVRRR